MKKILNNKIVMLIGGLIIVLLLVTILNITKKVSNLERLYLTNYSNDIMLYFSSLDVDDLENDKYVMYALEYNFNEYGKDNMTTTQIVDFINNKFDTKITNENINSIGITPIMAQNNVTYLHETDEYSLPNNKKSYSEISNIAIKKYLIQKIKKISDKKYKITFDKYVIENPYSILNYYNDLNINGNSYDTTDISGYLKGDNSLKDLNKYLTKKAVENIGKKEKEVTLTFKISNDKILLSLK